MTGDEQINVPRAPLAIGIVIFLVLASIWTKDLFFVFQWGMLSKYIWLTFSYATGVMLILSLVWDFPRPVAAYFLAISLVMPTFKLALVLWPGFSMEHVSVNATIGICAFICVGIALIVGVLSKFKIVAFRALLVAGLMIPLILQYTQSGADL